MNKAQKHTLAIGALALALCGVAGSAMPAQGESWTVQMPEPYAPSPTTPRHTYPPNGAHVTCQTPLCRQADAIIAGWDAHPAPSPTGWTVVRPTR